LSRLEAAERELETRKSRPAPVAAQDPDATARLVRDSIASAIGEYERRRPSPPPAKPEKYPDPPAPPDADTLLNDGRALVDWQRQNAEYWFNRARYEAKAEYDPRLQRAEQALGAMEHLLPELQAGIDARAEALALGRKVVPSKQHFDQLLPRALRVIESSDKPFEYRHNAEAVLSAIKLVIDREGLPQVSSPAAEEATVKGDATTKGSKSTKMKLDPTGLAIAEMIGGGPISKQDVERYARMSGRAR
jgi:hypothetical protein